MKKFFCRLLWLLILGSLGYTLFLAAPFGLFFHAFRTLNESEALFAFELHPLSGLIVIEDRSKEETALTPNQTITYKITDDTFKKIIVTYLPKRPVPGVFLKSLEIMIAPEMLALNLSWQCDFLGHRFYENTVFSEWQLRANGKEGQKTIEIRPTELHSNHLYSVNLAKYWTQTPWIHNPEGWLPLSSNSPQLHIQELILQDGAVSLTLGMEPEHTSDL